MLEFKSTLGKVLEELGESSILVDRWSRAYITIVYAIVGLYAMVCGMLWYDVVCYAMIW